MDETGDDSKNLEISISGPEENARTSYEHTDRKPNTPLKKTYRQSYSTSSIYKTPKKSPHKTSRKTPSKIQKLDIDTPRKLKAPSKAQATTPSKKNVSKSPALKRHRQDETLNDEPITKWKKVQRSSTSKGDDDDDEWEDIIEGDDMAQYIDSALEEKASKVPKLKMSAKNVKSVIHHVLTNEHVINMFQDALESKMEDISSNQSAAFVNSSTPRKLDLIPKMTRAKVKEFVGKICMPSPVKIVKDGLSILDVDFNEEEDDDEYNPEKDEECHESDDESILSSRRSDFGSPFPATPSTPGALSTSDPFSSSKTNREGSSTSTPKPSAKNLDLAFSSCAGPSTSGEPEGVDTIALRTRSKLPLTSTSITEIESAFVAPDITADMYDTNCEDAEWVQFLSSLYKPSGDDTVTDDDGDANDPEFNYMAEAEREKPDEEDFRFDKPTKITKKELNCLINELQELFEDEVLPYQVVAGVEDRADLLEPEPVNEPVPTTSSSTFTNFKTPQAPPQHNIPRPRHSESEPVVVESEAVLENYKQKKQGQALTAQQHFNQSTDSNTSSSLVVESPQTPDPELEAVTPEQRALIEDNMRKHIQLLLQNHFMFPDTIATMENLCSPQTLLTELNSFREMSPAGANSVYNVCNLDPALELVADTSLFAEPSAVETQNWQRDVKYMLTHKQKLAIYNSPAFVYPTMLPTLKKHKGTDRKFHIFLPSEDNLIALGLEQFQYCKNVNPVLLIHSLLIRGKNQEQILHRIQFLSSKRAGENAVKSVKKTGKLPDYFPKPYPDPYYPKAPKDQVAELLPTWCHHLQAKAKKPEGQQSNRLGQIQASTPRQTQCLTYLTPPSGASQSLTPQGDTQEILFTMNQSAVPSVGRIIPPPPSMPLVSAVSDAGSKQNSTIELGQHKGLCTPQGQPVAEHILTSGPQILTPPFSGSFIGQPTVQPSTAVQMISQVPMMRSQSQPTTSFQLLPKLGIGQSQQAVVLQKDVPITGIYIQFGTPGSSAAPVSQPVLSIGNVIVTRPSVPTPLQQGQRGTKRKMGRSVTRAKSLSATVSIHSDVPTANPSDTASTQTVTIPSSPDLLAKTMRSCGIENSSDYPLLGSVSSSPISCHRADTPLGTSSTAPSTATTQRTKHSSVRNLNPEFESSLSGESSFKVSDTPDVCQSVEGQAAISTEKNTPPSVEEIHSEICHGNDVTGSLSLSASNIQITASETLSTEKSELANVSQSVLQDKDDSSQKDALSNIPSRFSSDENIVLKKMEEQPAAIDGEVVPTIQESDNTDNKVLDTAVKTPPSTQETSRPSQSVTPNHDNNDTEILTVDTTKAVASPSPGKSSSDLTCFQSDETHSKREPGDIQTNAVVNLAKEGTSLIKSPHDSTSSESSKFALSNPGYEKPMKPKTVREMLEANRMREQQNKVVFLEQQSKALEVKTDTVIAPTNTDQLLSPPSKLSPGTLIGGFSSSSKKVDPCLLENSSSQALNNIAMLSPLDTLAALAFPSPIKRLDARAAFTSPLKTPTKVRPLAPKAVSPSQATTSSYVALPKISPKRKELNKQVRQILPKSFIFEVKSPSPTKAAAMVLKKKATMVCQHRSPVKILPKQPHISPGATRPRPVFTPTRMFTRAQLNKNKNSEKKDEEEDVATSEVDIEQETEKEATESEAEDTCLSQEEDEDEEYDDEDRMQLDDLMAACTTIGYEPKKGSIADCDKKSKAHKRRRICLAMLEPDILERDPKKDERDTAYAQHYFNQVKQVLQDDPERFRKFLSILQDLNKDRSNPVELYADMTSLLSDHQDLVDDFAGFLLAFQAVECECFVSHMEYQQIRTFLKQLEIYCDTSSLTFQRTLKMMAKWLNLSQEAQTDATPFKERICAILRNVPNLMSDLLSYFFDGPMPDCHPADFEEVDFENQDIRYMDEFEDVTLPHGREKYNTRACTCHCHDDPEDDKLRRRLKHCFSCSLRTLDGNLVLKMTHNEYRPVTLHYPLEEKEKMMRAKKEAAQLALAKARAQRQLNREKNKNKNRGKLKSKGSKRKKRKKIPPQNENQNSLMSEQRDGKSVIGPGNDENKTPGKRAAVKDESRPVREDVTDQTSESGTQSVASQGADDQPASDVKPLLTELQGTQDALRMQVILPVSSACVPASESSVPETDAALSPMQLQNTLTAVGTAPSDLVFGSNSPAPMTQSNTKDVVVVTSTVPVVTVAGSASHSHTSVTSLLTSGPCVTSGPDTSQFSGSSSSLSKILTDSKTASPHNLSKKALVVSQPLTSLTQLLSAPIQSIPASARPSFLMNRSVMPASQPYSFSPTIPTSITTNTTRPVAAHAVPQFQAPQQAVTARIPVIIALSPQQFPPSKTSHVQFPSPSTSHRSKQSSDLTQTSVHKAGDRLSLNSDPDDAPPKPVSHIISVSKEINGPSTNMENGSVTGEHVKPDVKFSSASLSEGSQDVRSVAIIDRICASDDVKNVSGSIVSSVGVATPKPSVPLCTQVSTTSITDTPVSAVPAQQPNPAVPSASNAKTCHMNVPLTTTDHNDKSPTKPAPHHQELPLQSPAKCVKEKLPELLRTHLENVSLTGFDDTMGLSSLQQLAQNMSPSKLQGETMSKFDLLAYIESSNLTCKEGKLQTGYSVPTHASTSESLLSFAGVIPKSTANVSDQDVVPVASAHSSHVSITPSVPVDQQSAKKKSENKNKGDAVEKDESGHTTTVAYTEENTSDLSDLWNEEMDRCILEVMTVEGITQTSLRKVQTRLPNRTLEELSSRAEILLDMMEKMGDTESDSCTDASRDSFY